MLLTKIVTRKFNTNVENHKTKSVPAIDRTQKKSQISRYFKNSYLDAALKDLIKIKSD